MRQMRSAILSILATSLAASAWTSAIAAELESARWSREKANEWYARQPWLVGCNFIPSTAVNQLEMWQGDTFDTETVGRELGWAAQIGFNSVRVYLHDLAWQADPEGFKKRIGEHLKIADRHGIRTAFVLLDDCWNPDPKIGKQPDPVPGVHNSGWVQSPGKKIVNDPTAWPRLERYIKDVVGTFGKDERIVFWDLYNEPGNSGQGTESLPLLEKAFQWAREAGPTQPLSAGIWFDDKELNDFQIDASDIITFHNYNGAASLAAQIKELKQHGRPVVCTEWLRRKVSAVQSHLPSFKRENVGCYNWGLVYGKTQTIYPWGSKEGSPEPDIWFHDLLRKDGRPFDPEEIELFKTLAGEKRSAVRQPKGNPDR